MNCPLCQKPVDALRARFVRVVAGQVTAYCSEACKNQDAGAFGDVLATGRNDGHLATRRGSEKAAAPVDHGTAVAPLAPAATVPAVVMATATKVAVAAAPAAADNADIAKLPAEPPTVNKVAIATTVAPKKSVSSAAIAATRQVAAVKSEGVAVRDAAKALGAARATSAAAAAAGTIATVSQGGDSPDAVGAGTRTWTWWLIGGTVLATVVAGLAYMKFARHAKPAANPAATLPITGPSLTPSTPTTTGDAPPRAADAVMPSAADVKARALQVLTELMESSVPRVQRVAAGALARSGNVKAIAKLHTLLANEQSALAKLEMAYAIARGGDTSGRLLLQRALSSTGRDQKGDAARLLVQLHDGDETAAVATLTGFLDISQHRLSAAETLAPLHTPAAIKVLDELAISTTIPADQRSRAIIALAHAGRREVIPQLTKLLTEPLYNAEAAIALAALGEISAAPVLREQLRLTSLQVAAARSLRKLAVTSPSVLPAETIVALADALRGDKDTVRAGVAEVVLLLTGDAAWADYE